MASKEYNHLQDVFLNTPRKERIPVSVFLVNGIVDGPDRILRPVRGVIEGPDQAAQMIFKHAISTISPSREAVAATRQRSPKPGEPWPASRPAAVRVSTSTAAPPR